ncbi:pumilio 24 [Artemisia annua]|uniref:Pumilio 24 n=1 Tax=Artemisia annua TaxID=35608 RepID=A0A2U1NYS6_ARTAN|nr:pumilio 24 [Artemisia annua]
MVVTMFYIPVCLIYVFCINRLVDIIAKLNLQKSAVVRHMSAVLQPILEKGIVGHSILHKVLVEYFTIADKTSAADVIQHVSSALLVRMIHTKDGSKVGILCIKHGSAQERKKIIKGMKDHNGRRPLLQLLHPNCSRYLSPDDLSLLDSSVPSLLTTDGAEAETEAKSSDAEGDEDMNDADETVKSVTGGKKGSCFTKTRVSLIDACTESAKELLRSNHGREVLFEVASGGADNILSPHLDEKLASLHEAIASVVATPKSEEEEEEHLLENFHSSRTIRKLILESPSFASTLWEKAFKGKCKTWARGHSAKVACAYLETTNPKVLKLAKKELQPLLKEGVLKLPEHNQPKKSG